MTDRELLELAAKAAGLTIVDRSAPITLYTENKRGIGGFAWNPLTEDGDALRLAVKLNLLDEHAGFTYKLGKEMGKNEDIYAATRRAIVRAAAEIGKSM